MNRAKTSYRNRLLSSPKIVLTSFLFLGLLIFANLVIAQSSGHNGGQWKSVGGKMAASGEGHFSNKWVAAHRYGSGDGKYWKNDEPGFDPTGRIKIPATHTQEEVNKDVWIRKGQITVRGPGFLGVFLRSKGAVVALKFPKSDRVFHAHGLGTDAWLGIHGNYKWYPSAIVDVDPTNSNSMGGWVPVDRTMTLDVWVHNPFGEWGAWGNGHNAPKDVEYEVWFFPREGGELISMGDYIQTGETVGFVTTGSVFDETTGKWLKPGDRVIREHSFRTEVDDNVTITLIGDWDGGVVRLGEKTRIKFKDKLTKTKGSGVWLGFGRIWSHFSRPFRPGFKVETLNSVTSCEGTSFETAYDPDSGKTTVSVFEGTVRLDCTKGKADPVMVNAGMQATMDNNCNHTLSVLGPDNNTPANAGWEVDAEPNNIDDKRDGEIVRIAPNADSYVYAYSYRNWDKANWGKHGSLGAGWHPTGGGKRTYLKFDLSGIDPKSVGKATLKLFHYHTGGNNSLSLGVHQVTGTWQEGSGTYHPDQTEKPAASGEISWVDQPAFDLSPVASFKPGAGIGKYIEVDITPLVKAWVSGTSNNGLVIAPIGSRRGTPESSYGFYSREHQDKSERPVLALSSSG